MGWRDLLRWRRNAAPPERRFSGNYTPLADLIESQAAKNNSPVDRETALTVPALLKGRNMLCSISTLPLIQYGPGQAVVRSSLLEQIDPDVANIVTLAQTVEDLLCEAVAWWQVIARDAEGFPSSARRLATERVSLTAPSGARSPLPSGVDPHEAVVYVDGKPVSARDIIRFDSPNPGILSVAARSIRKAILIDKLAAMFADNPRPLDYFSPAQGAEEPSDEEAAEIIAKWRSARKRSLTAWIPKALQYAQVSSPSPQDLQLVQLQERVSLEIANALGVDPEELGVSTTSRTYANVVDRRKDKINDVLSPYMLAITQRLSMRDVTRRGYTVAFNLDDYLRSNPTERATVQRAYLDMGVITREEIRLEEGWGPMPDELKQPEKPAETDPAEEPAGNEPAGDEPADGADAATQPTKVMTAALSHTFSGKRTFVDLPLSEGTFKADLDSRIIEGLALPYGQQASKYGGIRFEKGALQYDEVGHVKVLREHDPNQLVGVATELRDTREGLLIRAKIAATTAGDEALLLAGDGILDGLSVGVWFTDADVVDDPKFKGGVLVKRADLGEVSMVGIPAFRKARVSKVVASEIDNEGEPAMPEPTTEPTTAPEPAPVVVPAPAQPTTPEPAAAQAAAPEQTITLTQEQFNALLARPVQPSPAPAPPVEASAPGVVNPTVHPVPGRVQLGYEPVPYRFEGGRIVNTHPDEVERGEAHSFGADVFAMLYGGDKYGRSEAGKRVMGTLARYHNAVTRNFAIPTTSTDIATLIPTAVLDYTASPAFYMPLFELVNKGALPNGLQPFLPPSMSSSTDIAVATHTEGTEPTAKELITAGSAVTPSPMSAKVNITRVALDRVSGVDAIVWDELTKQYYKTVEDRVATFLATLTAADNIALDGLSHISLADTFTSALIFLMKGRHYNFVGLALEEALFKAFARARDNSGAGALLFPPARYTPTNVSGSMAERYVSIDLNGVTGFMSGALGTANSYLFDPAYVHGHATAPTRLDFAGSGASNIYTPVDTVDVAIWGYTAFYNTQIDAVKEITFNNAS